MKQLSSLLGDTLRASALHDFSGEEYRARSTEARAVRDRLPLFVRSPTAAELERRLAAPGLLTAAKAWHWGDGNVIFCGPTKVGKTSAAGYLFRRLLAEAVKHGGEAWELAKWMRWASAEDLAEARKTHPLGHGEPPELAEACNARLLFLDDAGWDRDVAEVASVLAARYERGWPTVITTGKTRDALTAHYGAAVVRRMREAGGKRAVVVDCFPKEGT